MLVCTEDLDKANSRSHRNLRWCGGNKCGTKREHSKQRHTADRLDGKSLLFQLLPGIWSRWATHDIYFVQIYISRNRTESKTRSTGIQTFLRPHIMFPEFVWTGYENCTNPIPVRVPLPSRSHSRRVLNHMHYGERFQKHKRCSLGERFHRFCVG